MHDLRYALRMLLKQPGFTAVAVLTLALGIGANTAIFSIVNAVLLRPLPYPDADRIMVLNESGGGQEFAVALPNYEDWKRDNTVFQYLSITRRESRNLSEVSGLQAERIPCAYVSEEFFKVIGFAPTLGRGFTAEEEKPGGPSAVIISDRLWQRVFARDPAVLNRTIKLHNQACTIVGVMPPGVSSPQDTDLWLPFGRRVVSLWSDRTIHPMLFVWGRLKPGVTVEQARTELKGIAARLEKEYPATNAQASVTVTPLLDNMIGKYRTNLSLLLGAVGLVLIIACANLANLFAARGAAREREFAIRAAVGASRGQIVRQLLIESFVVALIGGVLGVFVAMWLRDGLISLAPQGVSRFQEISFDLPVLGFAFVIASLTTFLFGLWPAWQTSRADVSLALKSGTQGSGDAPSAKRTRDWLVVSQIALTLTLLVAAALVLKSFSRMQALNLGYEPRNLMTARMELPFRVYNTPEKVGTFTNTLLEKVQGLPGVQSAGIGANSPLMGGWQTGFYKEGIATPTASQMPTADLEVVAGDYFGTFKVSLLRGRTFNSGDTKTSPRVIVVDQALAEQIFPGEDPIGRRIRVDVGNEDEGYQLAEIIGVVGRMRFHSLDETATPFPVIYCTMTQAYRAGFVLFVRAGNAGSLEKPIREIVSSIDPAQPVYDFRLMQDRVAETWGAQRLLTFLFSVFAGLALLLATIGLYGMLAYTTSKRVREIGVRLALGAQPSQIRRLILSHGMQLLLIGSCIGVVSAMALSRALRSVLFEATTIDPMMTIGAAVTLFLATFFASWIPAQRASRVDPIVALRTE